MGSLAQVGRIPVFEYGEQEVGYDYALFLLIFLNTAQMVYPRVFVLSRRSLSCSFVPCLTSSSSASCSIAAS